MKPPIHKKNCDPCKLCGNTTRFRRSGKCTGCVMLEGIINRGSVEKASREPDEMFLLMRHLNGERVDYGAR